MENRKPVATPMVPIEKLLQNGANLVDAKTYRNLIGSLIYLTNTRPDIMFSDIDAIAEETGGGGYYQPRGQGMEIMADHRDVHQWEFAIEEIMEFKVPKDWRGKDKISSWEKLKKKMRVAFLPHNYSRPMYQHWKNLRQNMRSMDDYTIEFSQLVSRNDLAEMDEQLVSRGHYSWKNRPIENLRRLLGVLWPDPRPIPAPVKPVSNLPPTIPPAIWAGGVTSVGDSWLRRNVFQSPCTIGGKVCRFVIDSGSCKNVVAEEAVQKLGLKTEPHPNPYKLSWLKKGDEVKVLKRCLIAFSIGSKYRDEIWCDVEMDACHLLLGRPWQDDVELHMTVVLILILCHLVIVYGFNPRALVGLAPVPNLKRINGKAEDFMAILTKDRYTAHVYNKLAAEKVGAVDIIEKINPNAHHLKLPGHVRTADVFNVKHLIPFLGDSLFDDDANSRENFFLEEEDDADAIAEESEKDTTVSTRN
ncbi:hypothetical protein RHSIM_Rhsim10G0125400 [Rhododendron simsii]|uniref:Retrotransposon gag domain-containing protein n=1 Tax=Rhododendron simsii TaxID=118357 RepID=A0A834LDC4_RHOSS|nr:hypothetical protein RHSIM_Rhsim10G0125400 [Rhododendron simsii]